METKRLATWVGLAKNWTIAAIVGFGLASGIVFGLGLGISLASAESMDDPSTAVPRKEDRYLSRALTRQLALLYPDARVELLGLPEWQGPEAHGQIRSVRLIDESARGDASFSVESNTENGLQVSQGSVRFAAYVQGRVAVRRILPGEALKPELFANQDVNVASGEGRELRGVILPARTQIEGLETRQTIIEGQSLLSSEIQRAPDVRRGDLVQIHLVSGGLLLSTPGTAEEPANLDGRIHVMASSSKRVLIGKLVSGGVVEVRL